MRSKVVGLYSGVVMMIALTLGVQATYGAPQMKNDSSSQTVTGCLQKGSESYAGYFIVDAQGKHWELYANSNVSLADEVGKTVTVTGGPANRTEEQEKKSKPSEKKEAGKGAHADLQVSAVKAVSDTCSK